MTGCVFCKVGPEDDCADDCMLRGLSASDAIVFAESRDYRIAILQAEAAALREHARLHP